MLLQMARAEIKLLLYLRRFGLSQVKDVEGLPENVFCATKLLRSLGAVNRFGRGVR
jgi:hypothetical protein